MQILLTKKNDHIITFILFEKRLSQLYVHKGCGFSHEYTVNYIEPNK